MNTLIVKLLLWNYTVNKNCEIKPVLTYFRFFKVK